MRPDECYHLAAQSFVSYSFDDEFSTLNANINGTHFLLAALKHLARDCRFYFAGLQRDVRSRRAGAAEREDPFPPPVLLRDQQGGRLRTDAQLPRGVRDALFQRLGRFELKAEPGPALTTPCI